MDLLAYNNERFVFTQNLTSFAAVYNLTTARHRVQFRPTPNSPVVLYEFDSAGSETHPGSALTYSAAAKTLQWTGPTADFAAFTGVLYWDSGFYLASAPTEFIRTDGGIITFKQGVTR